MNKIVTTNNVNFPYKWVSVGSFEDIQGLPKEDGAEKTVPCVCYFDRWRLMRNGINVSDKIIHRYPQSQYNIRFHTSIVGRKMGLFSYQFDINEWVDCLNEIFSLPSDAVYAALPISKENGPSIGLADVGLDNSRSNKFPKSVNSDKYDAAVDEVREQLSRTPNDPNMVIATENHWPIAERYIGFHDGHDGDDILDYSDDNNDRPF